MSKISFFKDYDCNEDSKILFEIVTKSDNSTERSIININKEVFITKGVELRLGFYGYGEVELPKVEDPIIYTEISQLDSSKEIIFKFGRSKCARIKVVIECDNNLFLECTHIISKDCDLLSQRSFVSKDNDKVIIQRDMVSNKEDTPEEEVFKNQVIEEESKCLLDNQVHSIEGSLYYVIPVGEKQPRNVCVNGIRVKLYNKDNKLISTRITRRIGKKNGFFKFSGLESGEYYIKILLPCNFDIIHGDNLQINKELINLSLNNNDVRNISIGVIRKG